MNSVRIQKGLLGLAVGLLALLPACGPRRNWAAPTLTAKTAHYIDEIDDVRIMVKKLSKSEAHSLFDGQGGDLFKGGYWAGQAGAQPIMVQVTNKSSNPVQFARNGFNVTTLGAQEVYRVVRKDPVGRAFAWGVPLSFVLTPVGGLLIGWCVHDSIHRDNKDVKAEVSACMLNDSIDVLPGQTAKALVAAILPDEGAFEIAIPDLGLHAASRTFVVDTSESPIVWS